MPHNSELLMDKVEGAGIRTNSQRIQNQGRPIMSKDERATGLRHLLCSSTPVWEDKESTRCLLISRLMRVEIAGFFGFVPLLVSRLLKKEKRLDCIGYLLGYWIVGWWASGNWNKWIGNIGLVELSWNELVDGIAWELKSFGRFGFGLLQKGPNKMGEMSPNINLSTI